MPIEVKDIITDYELCVQLKSTRGMDNALLVEIFDNRSTHITINEVPKQHGLFKVLSQVPIERELRGGNVSFLDLRRFNHETH